MGQRKSNATCVSFEDQRTLVMQVQVKAEGS